MDNENKDLPWQGYETSPVQRIPAEKKEAVFAVLSVVCGLLLSNFTLYGGFHLGFAVAIILWICISAGYLLRSGCRMNGYSGALLGLSVVIAAGFARSDDGFVKFVMLCFLCVSINLGLCLLAGQNSRSTHGIASLLDAPRGLFILGFGKLSPALRGVGDAVKNGGTAVRKGGAVVLGLVVAVPVLAIVIPLLMSADAAFDGLVEQLPQLEMGELISTAIFGVAAACVAYSRGVGLRHTSKQETASRTGRTVSHWTVNTVLAAVCFVYLVYLFSQLAYFVGGFAGILPEGFTMAEYARRGFFEMAWLCAINLAIMSMAVGLAEKKEGKTLLSTRLLCLFIGVVTVFLVATASAKMLLYIDAYGLTRLRVLTEVIMVFLGVTTVIVSVWLFLPALPYMKWVLLLALVIGAVVFWGDVDAVVASYNVSAYQSGRLETVDMGHLEDLGDSAMPYVARLTEDADDIVAYRAEAILKEHGYGCEDLRSWNFASWYARLLRQEE